MTSKGPVALACMAVEARKMQRASCRQCPASGARPAQRAFDAVPWTAGTGLAEEPSLQGRWVGAETLVALS